MLIDSFRKTPILITWGPVRDKPLYKSSGFAPDTPQLFYLKVWFNTPRLKGIKALKQLVLNQTI